VSEATRTTVRSNERVREELPFADRQDFEDARRGFIATLSPMIIESTEGRPVWDMESFAFIAREAEAPSSVNPSLWRQSQLVGIHGLFEVVPGIYQVRGFDLSNVTFVEGDRGVVVIDPLISNETAAAALALYREHRGDRPVMGVIYTHSHVDHFGGVKGIVSQEEVDGGDVPIVAPEHFLEHAVSENVFAGVAMSRRAAYMYGALLPPGPQGQVGAGLGQTTSTGTVSLIAPTIDVTETGQELTLDGVRIVFQLTPGTEAPAEMNFLFPERSALCMAENATHNLHNVVTLRGALVRDAHVWSTYLGESIQLFGDRTDVVFASHHWPRWGRDRAIEFIAKQRDLYGYLHDQTLRLMNKGYVGSEIAEMMELPPALANEWSCRGYYGSVSHNVKAIYQRYMGWYDGNPAHLWQHPPEEAATRYVAFMGGRDAALERARASYAAGDYRWVAEVASHLVFADPEDREARALEADALEQLGYGAECGTWRNVFLMGALELREGNKGTPAASTSPEMVRALNFEQVLDALALQIDGPRAWDVEIVVNWRLTDTGERATLRLANGVLTHVLDAQDPAADVSLVMGRDQLAELAGGTLDLRAAAERGEVSIGGDVDRLQTLVSLLDPGDRNFSIVLP